MKAKKWNFNMDDGTINVIYENGSSVSFLCSAIEAELHTTLASESKLQWLKDNEPSTYAQLAVSGELQSYLDRYSHSYYEQQDNIEKQLTDHFNGDKAYAASIAREIMMYGG